LKIIGGNRAYSAIAICIALVQLSACTRPPNNSPSADPLEKINRPINSFNNGLDTVIIRPVAKGYSAVTPQGFRGKVSNFFGNLSYPVDIINAFLQGKFEQGFQDTGRFALNSTLGLAGFLDPATLVGLPEHEEDFGQTFSVWGIPQGPYVVLPILGPSTVTSAVGIWPNVQVNPITAWPQSSVRAKLVIGWTIETRERLLAVDEAVRESFDPYLFVRDAYLQNRRYLIFDGNPPSSSFDDEFDAAFDDAFEDEFDSESNSEADTGFDEEI